MIRFSIKARSLVIALSPFMTAALVELAGLKLHLLQNHALDVALIAAMFAPVAAYLTAVILASRISRRIRQMIRSTALIKTGMPILTLDRSPDELGQLAASLSEMSVQVLRQRAEVIENKDRLEAIFRATKHTAILAEDTKGRIFLCNPGAERLLGYDNDEMMGRMLDEVVHRDAHVDYEPQLRREFQDARRQAWQSNEQDRESIFIRKNGVRVDVQLSIAPLKDMHGKVIGLLHVAHDITPRKVLESELRHRNNSLTACNLELAHLHPPAANSPEDILPRFVRHNDEPETTSARTLDAAIRRAEGSLNTGPRRLLVVDDFEAARTLIKVQLTDVDCELDFASDGEEALQKIAQHHYDLVLMDIEMPRMNGHETIRRVRLWERENNRLPIPVVAMTAHSNLDQPGANQSHWNSVLHKPLTQLKLITEVRAYLAR